MGTMSVLSKTLSVTLEVGFCTERGWSQNSYYGNSTKDVICFFCDGH